MIINELAEHLNHRKLFNDKDELDNSMLNQINLYIEKNNLKEFDDVKDSIFENEKLIINQEDYYYSNVIARSSKTMLDCKNAKIDFKLTGTEG